MTGFFVLSAMALRSAPIPARDHTMTSIGVNQFSHHAPKTVAIGNDPMLAFHPLRFSSRQLGQFVQSLAGSRDVIVRNQTIILDQVEWLLGGRNTTGEHGQAVEQALDQGLGHALCLVGGKKNKGQRR